MSNRSSAASAAYDTPIVTVVDDDLAVREGLEALVNAAGWQCRTFTLAREFLASPRVLLPGCLLLDVDLPDLSGLELQRLIAQRIELPVIFVTGFCDVSMAVRAMKAGAFEFMTKPFRGEFMLSVIASAIARSRIALSRELDRQALLRDFESLSDRERQIMAFVVLGKSSKGIAGTLGISENTVKAHRSRLMCKLKARSVHELLIMATRLSLIPEFDVIPPGPRKVRDDLIRARWDGSSEAMHHGVREPT
jgi:FixJ family two-component response regulator